jgi:hypothetical protein
MADPTDYWPTVTSGAIWRATRRQAEWLQPVSGGAGPGDSRRRQGAADSPTYIDVPLTSLRR